MSDIQTNLVELVDQQALVSRAMASCKIFLDNDRNENGFAADPTKLISEFSVEDIELRFDKQSFVFENRLLGYPYFDTQLGLYVQTSSGELQIGHYRLITTVDGEASDDYLVFYPRSDASERR